jgi:hypothetical protein
MTAATFTAAAYVVVCSPCERSDGPFDDLAEAQATAAAHNGLLHGAWPTAEVQPLGTCESCRLAPAVTTWTHPGAGAPFTLCAACIPPGGAA